MNRTRRCAAFPRCTRRALAPTTFSLIPASRLHRDPWGLLPTALHVASNGTVNRRRSFATLAAAIDNHSVQIDDLVIPWTPTLRQASELPRNLWRRLLRREGCAHRQLRGEALPYVFWLAGRQRVDVEWTGAGAHVRPDLALCRSDGMYVAVEFGDVRADAIAALLVDRQPRLVSHVVVLPYVGRREAGELRGYAFRLSGTARLPIANAEKLAVCWRATMRWFAPALTMRIRPTPAPAACWWDTSSSRSKWIAAVGDVGATSSTTAEARRRTTGGANATRRRRRISP